MFDTGRRYKIHWELTDICNLKCPMCPRTDTFNRCRPVKEIQNTQLFLEDVKAYLPDSFLKRMNRIDFCGNFGDPCIARDFYEICEFLVLNYKIPINVSTNGSMRRPAWWKKLGALFAETDSRIEFHMDGLRDTHHLYRIGANWDKIMANAEAFISGGAKADWYYILFEHNQHQIGEAYEIARKMGFTYFVLVETGRFPTGGIYRYIHPDGKRRDLKQATISAKDGMGTTAIRQKHAYLSSPRKNEKAAAPDVTFQKKMRKSFTAVNGITCKSAVKNRFFLDSQGYIAPCCWVLNHDVQRPGDMRRSVSLVGRNVESFNIRNRPIEEILQDELFTQVFSDLWESDSLVTCRKKCGKTHRNDTFKIKL